MEDLKSVLKTTSKYTDILSINSINTLKDLLYYFPRSYEDRSKLTPISEIFFKVEANATLTIQGKIISKKMTKRANKILRELIIEDEHNNTGHIFFSSKAYQVRSIKTQQHYMVIGKPQIKSGQINFWYPEIIESGDRSEKRKDLDEYQTWRIYPIYPEVMWIKAWRFAQKIRKQCDAIPIVCPEHLPKQCVEIFQLLDLPTTIKQMHFPDSWKLHEKAKTRIFFDRLLKIQLHAQLFKNDYNKKTTNTKEQLTIEKITKRDEVPRQQEYLIKGDHNKKRESTEEKNSVPDREIIREITQALPFELTTAQKRVIKEMIEDIHKPRAMLRLLQWDVGSGKTVVTAIVAYYIIKKEGWQVAFLAPLSILAQQHYETLAKLLLPLWIKIAHIAWSHKTSYKEKLKSDLLHGKIDLVVGTHALIQDDVKFESLQLAIVDEQHKFWVNQRAFFKKCWSPHIIQMSATPIPRSLALAYFGEFDVSIIDELPKGRKPITTKIVTEKQFIKLRPWVVAKLSEGQKMFVVTPLIEESEKMENLKAATTEREKICSLFPEYKNKIGLIHGKLKAKDKEKIMEAFKKGTYTILVATTVIEVGVDIKQATLMIIKNAERFGLSQLHQLRWRIGRNDLASYCFLETHNASGDTYKRLKAMEETNDGFTLAEIDLRYRGSGEILWTRQSGETDIPREIISDTSFVEKVKRAANRLLEHYPNLEWLDQLEELLHATAPTLLV